MTMHVYDKHELMLLPGLAPDERTPQRLTINVLTGLNCIAFIIGYIFGQVTSVIGSLQKNEEGLDFSEGQISVIAATLTATCYFGFVLSAITADKIGRRWPFIIFSTTTLINWIVLYHAKEMYQFIISRVLAGVSVGALASASIFVTSEYTSPNTRAFFLNMVSTVCSGLGTSFVHAIGIVLHWRTVVLIGIFPAALGIVLPYFWVESPHWLASKGKFEESEKAFWKLHKRTSKSEKELQLLIKMEKSKLEIARETNCEPTLKRLLLVFKKKYFWKLFIMSIFIHAYLSASGKLIFSVLGTVILEEITGTSDIFLFTLVIDGFIFIGSCLSCIFIRKTSMRTLLFSTGFAGNAILVLFSICFYFKNDQRYFDWINVVLLAMYYIVMNTGPNPLLEAIYSEMFPLDLKGYIFSLSGLILVMGFSLSIILLPYIVSAVGYHGLFILNAAIMSVSLGYIWVVFPETKGKTLQEIEVYFKTRNFDLDDVLSRDQLKALL